MLIKTLTTYFLFFGLVNSSGFFSNVLNASELNNLVIQSFVSCPTGNLVVDARKDKIDICRVKKNITHEAKCPNLTKSQINTYLRNINRELSANSMRNAVEYIFNRYANRGEKRHDEGIDFCQYQVAGVPH